METGKRLLSIEPRSAELQTLTHRHAAGLEFEADGRRWRHEAGRAERAGATVYGRVGGLEACVWLEDAGWRMAAAGVLDISPHDIDPLPEPLVRSALECFASGVLGALQRGVGLPVELSRLELGDAAIPGAACRFCLVSEEGLRVEGGWLAFGGDDEAFLAIKQALSRLPAHEEALPDDTPVAVRLCPAVWRMPLAQLKTLEPGDVALSPSGPEWRVTTSGGVRFAASRRDGVIVVEGNTMTQENATEESGSDAGVDAAPVSLDAVEVEVQAVAGRMTMTLGQLRQLGAGQIVEFAAPVSEPAQLVVGGKTVATGELVDVGGRVGLRIASVGSV